MLTNIIYFVVRNKKSLTAFGFLMVASIVLFTFFSIVFGYMLLQNAVVSIAEQSSFYTFISFLDAMQRSMTQDHAGITKVRLIPRYVMFLAAFDSVTDMNYWEPDSTLLFDVATKSDNCDFYENVMMSSSGGFSTWNEGIQTRKELDGCVDEVCLCLAEVNSFLVLDREYFIADTCYPICWGEDVTTFDHCLNNNECENGVSGSMPIDIINECIDSVRSAKPDGLCAACVNYLERMYDKGEEGVDGSLYYDPAFGRVITEYGYPGLRVLNEDAYSVLLLDNDNYDVVGQPNEQGYELLKEFSKATKFAFASNIVECRPLSGLGGAGGSESGYCYVDNQNNFIPYSLYYLSDYDSGILTVFTTSQRLNERFYPNDVDFDLVNMAFSINSFAEPTSCFWFPTAIQIESSGGGLV